MDELDCSMSWCFFRGRRAGLIVLGTMLLALSVAGSAKGQTAPADDVTAAPAAAKVRESVRPPEAAIEGLERVDKGTLALTLGAKKLLLYDFEFDGAPVATDKLHLKQLAPGVFEVTSIAYTVGEWRVRVRDGASYYGLGEHFDTLNHAHTVVRNLMQQAGADGGRGSGTAKPVPFFMSTTGYGMWFDTTGAAMFDMNAASETEIIVDGDAEKLRIVLFAGPEFAKILEHFTVLARDAASGAASGAVPLPLWAFGSWLSGTCGSDAADAAIDAAIDQAHALHLSESVVVCALGTPPAAARMKQLHEQGYKVIVPQSGWVEQGAGGYAEAAASGFFVKNAAGGPYVMASVMASRSGAGSDSAPEQGSWVDLTNQRARLWWNQRLEEATRAGADGFTGPEREPVFPADARFGDESDARMMRNRYALLRMEAEAEEVRKQLKGDGLILTSAATTGLGPATVVSSDVTASFSAEDGLPTAITAALGAGLSGMGLWTARLTGTRQTGPVKSDGDKDAAFLMRWTEFAAFTPVMQTALTQTAADLVPWQEGEAALATYRRYSVLHASLLPYRYAAAQQAVKTGMPVMRALAIDFQNDAQARAARNEYMFGPDLLVAPIVDEGTQRAVYLPQGDWLDLWTGAPAAGGRTVVVQAALDSIPVWVRDGAILAKLPEEAAVPVVRSEIDSAVSTAKDLRRVYELYGSAAATITDFEGRVVVRSGKNLTITGVAAPIVVRWRFQNVRSATVGGTAVKVQVDAQGSFIELDHATQTVVAWE